MSDFTIDDLTRLVVRHRRYEYWTTVERIVLNDDGEPQLKSTTCCCKSPGRTRKECQLAASHKNPCRCFCHSKKLK
jgi:hypothetical protein